MILADQAQNTNSEAYNGTLQEIFGKRVVGTRDAYRLIFQIPFQSYITLNYDPLLATAARGDQNESARKIIRYPECDIRGLEKGSIFYLHGYIDLNTKLDDIQIVLTKSDFDLAYDNDRSKLPSFLETLVLHYPVLFWGCTLSEEPIKKLLERCSRIRKRYSVEHNSKQYPLFMLLPKKENPPMNNEKESRIRQIENEETERYRRFGITVARYDKRDKRYSGIEEILEAWVQCPPLPLGESPVLLRNI